MEESQVDEFLERSAPSDVKETIAWLSANGYALSSHVGEGAFGAQFVYTGDAKVLITVDRSQWSLDVAPRPDAEAWQYNLLIAARTGRSYGDVFPWVARSPGDPLPNQLPEGVSWRETLPGILEWVSLDEAPAAVERAQRERHELWRARH